jgi:hypothetical protein
MSRWPFLVPLLFLSATFCAVPASADKRVALVVGNSAYRNVAILDNPAKDARLLADTLSSLGFTLVGGGAQLDLDKPSLDRAVQAFGSQLAGADVGLFYYAGHGVQVRGENYLIPVDANPTKEADVDFQMLDANLVLRQMEGAGTRLNIVILDACRNNPFGGRGLAVDRARAAENTRLRDTRGGLAQMQAPQGTLISFATQPGSVAQDGGDGNSPYAKALALTMRRPNLDIFQMFNQVGLTVKRATGGAQQPWVSSSPIDGTFYFVAASHSDTSASTPADAHRFDGVWTASLVCESTSTLPGWRYEFVGRVRNGTLHVQRSVEGAPGSETFDGMIEPDGTAEISQTGFSQDSKTDPFHRPTGTQFHSTYAGRFDDSRGTFTRLDRASCKINFARQEPIRVGSLTPPSTAPDVGRFDGFWVTTIVCESIGDVSGWSTKFIGKVKGGVFHGQVGMEGKPGSNNYDATIDPDGAMEFVSKNISSADIKSNLNHAPPGLPGTWRAAGRFEDSHGSAIRVEGRPCKIDFTKR